MSNKNTIENSSISETASIGKMSVILNTTLEESCMVGSFSKMAYSKMDDLSYIGDYTVVINSNIGKFCSISWGVTIGPEEHDFNRVTSHSFLYSTKSFQLVNEKKYSPFVNECIIGNNVWIGCNSTILRGVKIGDGAVIGANSLVNKDVPPYAIVVGSPAKIVKYRFSSEIIAGLLDLQWWNLPIEVVSNNADLFAKEPTVEILQRLKDVKQKSI